MFNAHTLTVYGPATWTSLSELLVSLTCPPSPAYPLTSNSSSLLVTRIPSSLKNTTTCGLNLQFPCVSSLPAPFGYTSRPYWHLIVPHLVRLAGGTASHRFLVPVAAITGAVILLLGDTLARVVVAPVELPVGPLMVVLGVPFFLWLLRKAT